MYSLPAGHVACGHAFMSVAMVAITFICFYRSGESIDTSIHQHAAVVWVPLAVSCLEQETDVRQISHIVLTHVGPNRVSTLLSVLDKALQGRPAGSMKLVLSNPALKVLQAGMQGKGNTNAVCIRRLHTAVRCACCDMLHACNTNVLSCTVAHQRQKYASKQWNCRTHYHSLPWACVCVSRRTQMAYGLPLLTLLSGAGKPDLLSGLDVIVVKSGDEQIDITDKYSLEATLTPTPRWPDLMCVFEPKSKVMFTSKLFSAHVSPELLKVNGA